LYAISWITISTAIAGLDPVSEYLKTMYGRGLLLGRAEIYP